MKKIILMLSLFVVALAFAPSAKAFDLSMGNSPVKDRTNVDSYHNFSIVDTNQSAEFEGIITEIQYFARNTNPFKFLLVDETRKVMWKSDLINPTSGVEQTYTLATA